MPDLQGILAVVAGASRGQGVVWPSLSGRREPLCA
jgi:hypothetical protein